MDRISVRSGCEDFHLSSSSRGASSEKNTGSLPDLQIVEGLPSKTLKVGDFKRSVQQQCSPSARARRRWRDAIARVRADVAKAK